MSFPRGKIIQLGKFYQNNIWISNPVTVAYIQKAESLKQFGKTIKEWQVINRTKLDYYSVASLKRAW